MNNHATGPGELIDVVVTERGIAINPRRQDLHDAVKGSSLPIRPIEEIKAEVDALRGKPVRPKLGERPVAIVLAGWDCAGHSLAGGLENSGPRINADFHGFKF